mmetsp:Transcript_41933/g.94224  ORF Transcript_41933/g.94224 Transcript_41933/m.94224 type:complete len:145 (-) Transcript_41933:82-516(-)
MSVAIAQTRRLGLLDLGARLARHSHAAPKRLQQRRCCAHMSTSEALQPETAWLSSGQELAFLWKTGQLQRQESAVNHTTESPTMCLPMRALQAPIEDSAPQADKDLPGNELSLPILCARVSKKRKIIERKRRRRMGERVSMRMR